MNKPCMKTTATAVSLIAGSLISACAHSGGELVEQGTPPVTMPPPVGKMSARTEQELKGNGPDLAVVFALDKSGRIKAFRPGSSKPETHPRFPLPAGKILNMNSITTFETSNPKYCWYQNGTLTCIEW